MASIDPANLSVWYDAYAAALVLYARQLAPPGLARDVVQDAFLRLMAQRTPPRDAKAWLYRTVRNGALSQSRSHGRRRRRERSRAGERAEAFESRPDALVDARAAEDALRQVPPGLREVVVLRIWADMTLQDIADLIGQSVSTALRRYRQGLAEVRKGMGAPCHPKRT